MSTACLAAGLLFAAALHGAPGPGLLHAGLVVLMATPVLRVAVSIGAFSRAREWWLVACASVVLLLLVISILIAIRA